MAFDEVFFTADWLVGNESFGHQEPVGRDPQAGMVVEPSPATALVVPQPEVLLGVRGAMEQKTGLKVFYETFVLSNIARAAAIQWNEGETGTKNWSDKSKFELAQRSRVF